MSLDEVFLWERLAKSRRVPLEPDWLGEVYSPILSFDLRRALCEKLGMQAERGWPVIQDLLVKYGVQPDLVMAAGLCHQSEARDWWGHPSSRRGAAAAPVSGYGGWPSPA